MNRNGNMDSLDPLVSGFGPPIRESAVPAGHRDPDCCGKDSAGVQLFRTPGLHVQDNGMLAYVPDMDEIEHRVPEPEEDGTTDPQPEEHLGDPDFLCSADKITQEGVYLVEHSSDERYLRWFDGSNWRNGRTVNVPARKTRDLCDPERGLNRSSQSSILVLGACSITPEQIRSGSFTVQDLVNSVTQHTRKKSLKFPCKATEVTKPGLYYTEYGEAPCTAYKYTDGRGNWSNGHDHVDPTDKDFVAFLRKDAAMDNGYVPTRVLSEVPL